jgi:hypothetical protein
MAKSMPRTILSYFEFVKYSPATGKGPHIVIYHETNGLYGSRITARGEQ